jgi:ABC-type branched-subunit amino acid transport system substrate-binding protein
VLAVAVGGGIWWLPSHLGCADGLPSSALWSAGSECVGVSESAYDFGHREFDATLTKIDQQNQAVQDGTSGCPTGSPVTVGALVALGSSSAGGRSVRELEGFAAAQAEANAAGCVHPLRIRVANMGSGEQAATDVAQRLKDDPDVVAVVGMGVSSQASAAAADLLARRPGPVPMVSDVITAEGFDASGSQGKENVFTSCAASYPHGVGGGYFYRVAYSNSTQINGLKTYLGRTRPDFIVTPTDLSDPYTCTALSLVKNRYKEVTAVKFDPVDASTVGVAVQRICGADGPVTAFYTARSIDLGRFIQDIDNADQNGHCSSRSITLVSTSDANRLLAPEPDPALEGVRKTALDSKIFTSGKLKLVYSALENADSTTNTPQYQRLAGRMSAYGFPPGDLADGWAINAYDALGSITEASQTLPATQTVTRGQINASVSGLSTVGAGGRISFDAAGDRNGGPAILRLCPPRDGRSAFTVRTSAPSCRPD